MLRLRPGAIGGVASLGFHLAFVGWLSELPPVALLDGAPELAVEFVATSPAGQPAHRATSDALPIEVLAGGRSADGLLSAERGGRRGGDGGSLGPVILLLPDADDVTLQDSVMNNIAERQTQRIRTSRDSASLEFRRATPNPSDNEQVTTGHGHTVERLRNARGRPAAGAASRHDEPSAPSDLRATESEGLLQARELQRRVAMGIHRGEGPRHRRAAALQLARPSVDRGPAATIAHTKDASVRDNVNAELLTGGLESSWVEASARPSPESRPGAGGALGLSAPGIALTDRGGSRARPHNPGAGRDGALDTRDARYMRWFAMQRKRVASQLVFPLERALAMDQGTSLYRVVVRRDGRVAGPPSLIRSSGHNDLDTAARVAIQSAIPFAPLPPELAPNEDTIAILFPIDFFNPMVR